MRYFPKEKNYYRYKKREKNKMEKINLDKEICKTYKVFPKRISDKKLLNCLNEIVLNKEKITIHNTEYDICNYSFLLEVEPQEIISDDEEYPANIGAGWDIREGIKTLLLSEDIVEYLYDEIKWELMNKIERFWYVLTP